MKNPEYAEALKARWKVNYERRQVRMRKEKAVQRAEAIREEKERIKREGSVRVCLEVIRCGPNPRILVCRYEDPQSGEKRVVKVKVRRVERFVRGMKFEEFNQWEVMGEDWEYTGREPRFKGRW
jgi:hypothetical protein